MILSIFTPTYNRAHLLEKLFLSLQEQDSRFEWIVIDDGSTDNTEEVIQEFIKRADFPITYIKKENGGKHTAHNRALEFAKGDLFMGVDSDDWLANDAVKKALRFSHKLIESDCGFLAYKEDAHGNILSCAIPEMENQHFKANAAISRLSASSEFCFIFKTAVLKKHPYPIMGTETFIGECVLYDALELAGYTVCLCPEVLEACEYQMDGLTVNINHIMKQNPLGYCYYFMQRIDLVSSLRERLIVCGKYHAFCFFAGKNKTPYTGKHRILVVLAKPLGVAFRYYYKFFRGF